MSERGFAPCAKCWGRGRLTGLPQSLYEKPCPRCSGTGLLPADQLREDVARIIQRNDSGTVDYAHNKARDVLAKVAEHLRGDR